MLKRNPWLFGALLVLLVTAVMPSQRALGADFRVERTADGRVRLTNDGAGRGNAKARVNLPGLAVPRETDSSIEALINVHAAEQALEPELVKALIHAESAFNPLARSHKGAMGLMQLMPATARSLAVDDPYSPGQNIRGGTSYLRNMIDLFGRTDLALAAYNAGPGAVQRYGGIPPYRETQNYVRKVLALRLAYRSGKPVPIPAAGGGPVRVVKIGDRVVITNQ